MTMFPFVVSGLALVAYHVLKYIDKKERCKEMSADEIRRLAKDLSFKGDYAVGKEFVDFDLVFDSSKNVEIRKALLSFAAMVERCEERHADPYGISDEDYNYILKGARDECK
ncbi:unnamed protein product [Cylicocyclus nassatus]|uniref:Uncharacterized protein n=1 Tax=Cylicocyclus nassatus TaxID=53992 RepID=A0AA36DR60_CYLNA|nr:unnamed protein product [Cylicocyclus nassatus]